MSRHFEYKLCNAFLVLTIIGILLLSPFQSGSFGAQSAAKSSPTIEKILPYRATPGNPVEIYLNQDLSSYTPGSVQVFFNNTVGATLSIRGNLLVVRLPEKLPPTRIVSVVVEAPRFKTPPYQWSASFQRPNVALAIERIAPEKALPGDSIEIFMNRDISSLKYRDFRVSFDGIPGEVLDSSNRFLKVRVPGQLSAGDNINVIVATPTSTTTPFPFTCLAAQVWTIKKITPDKAYPGDSVEILLNQDLSAIASSDLKVGFDSVPGEVLGSGSNIIKARIPEKSLPGNNIWVVVSTAAFKTEPFSGFSVIAPRSSTSLLKSNYVLGSLIAVLAIAAALFLRWWMRTSSRKQALQQEVEKLRSALEQRNSPMAQVSISTAEGGQEFQPPDTQTPAAQVEQRSQMSDAFPPIPHLPDVPMEIIDACQKGECVVFVGSDLGRPAGIPTWQEFVNGLLGWASSNRLLDEKLFYSYVDALKAGQADLVADGVASAVNASGKPTQDMLIEYLGSVFRKPSSKPTAVHRLLKQIGFTTALTNSLDSLLEQALDAPVFVPQDSQKLLPLLAERSPFLLKLFGTLDKPETVQISPAQCRDTFAANRVFVEFIDKLFLSRAVLFIGASLDSIQSNFMEISQTRYMRRPHYALVEVSGREWQAKAESLQRRFNIQVLPYSAVEGDAALQRFFEQLARQIPGKERFSKAGASETPRLKHLKLTNIGPFKNLDLNLDPSWNILLGDNGVGKSNILKAIALALCGRNAQSFADRLIKYGEPSGQIVLELSDGAVNVVDLYRTSSEAEIKSTLQRELLGTERWLAIAFPPLRHLGWIDPKGPQPKPGTPYSTPGDLLPLINGDPDPRMTDLKQSILNYDSQSRVEGGARYQKLLDDFFNVMGEITHGVTLRGWQIDRNKTWQISVETDDGKVPLAAVSQGTQSLMGWIGLMLERLYEVYENTDNPRDGAGLVLLDEIDAHMHPLWQQMIVQKLTGIFPNMQFIATSHSPLIVGGMPVRQVIRFARNIDRLVKQLDVEEDMTMGRTDQLLTSNLFGLPSTLDKVTQDMIDDIQKLARRPVRSDDEEKRLQSLRHELTLRIPAIPEMPAERRAHELVDALLSHHVMELIPTTDKAELEAAKQKLLNKARQLLNEVQNQRGVAQ